MVRNRTKALETIEIGEGKYTKIVERIKYLANNENYSIETFSEYIESINSWKVKAILTIEEEGKTMKYSGTACEKIGSSDINMTSALENAETSAVGRACAFAGIGLTDEIASADEVSGAKEKLKDAKTESRRQVGKSAESNTLAKLTAKAKEKNEK